MTKKLAVVCGASILTLSSSAGFSSSAVAIIAPQGIVVGVDGKSVDRCDGPCGPATESKKVVLVLGRIAFTTAGLHTVLGNPHLVAPYSFPSFAGQVGARLTRDATVSQVSGIVDEEAEKVFSWFELYLRRAVIRQEDFPGEHPVEYLIAGYETGVPTVYSVHVEVDWQQLRLKAVQRVLLYPGAEDKEPRGVCAVGSKRVLQQLRQGYGDLYQRMMARAPVEGRLLVDKEELSLKHASKLVRALLETEAEANPEHVGPPFVIATIPRQGSPHLDPY